MAFLLRVDRDRDDCVQLVPRRDTPLNGVE
jgi:hypothetical protein